MMTALTPKQERFCQKYIETGNASEAYRQAYNVANMKPESVNRKAKELIDNVKITARIEALQAEHKARHILTIDTILNDLQNIVDQCLGRKRVTVTLATKDSQTGEAKPIELSKLIYDPTGALKAIELMGKHLGMFTGKEQAQVQTLPAQIQVTFGELKQHIEEIGQ